MSGAHKVTWWGAFDPYTFGVWISEDKVHDFPTLPSSTASTC
jgi:hypothetical protein